MRFKIKRYLFGDNRYKKRFAFIPTILDCEEDYNSYTFIWLKFFYKRQEYVGHCQWLTQEHISVEEYEKRMKEKDKHYGL